MRKIILIGIISMLIYFAAPLDGYAQSRRYTEGTIAPVRVGSVIFNLGAGAGADYRDNYYYSPFGMKAAVEWGLWNAGPGVITLGPEMGMSFSGNGYYRDYNDYHSRTFIMAGRSAWHYGWKVRGLDTYGGFSAGIGIHHYDYYYTDNTYYSHNEAIPVFGAYVGASYFVAPHFGFNAEAGYDITNFQVGVVFKLK